MPTCRECRTPIVKCKLCDDVICITPICVRCVKDPYLAIKHIDKFGFGNIVINPKNKKDMYRGTITNPWPKWIPRRVALDIAKAKKEQDNPRK